MYSRCFHWFPGPLAPSDKVLAGEVDAGTARGKSKLPKGLQVPSGLVATEEEEELESEPPIHFTLEI